MKKIIVIVLSIITALTCFPAFGAESEDELMSSETLDIVSHINDYDENEARTRFAQGGEGYMLSLIHIYRALQARCCRL